MKQLETLKAEGRIEEARQHGLLQLIAHPRHAGCITKLPACTITWDERHRPFHSTNRLSHWG